MLNCIDRLLSINNPCDSSECRGIYDITDVPGFTWGKVAGIAEGNFKDYTGYEVAIRARRIAAKTAISDIMAQMNLRNWATNLTSGTFKTGEFTANKPAGSVIKRGVQITVNKKCLYAGMKLKSIAVKAWESVTTTLYVQVDDTLISTEIVLVAGVVKTINNICNEAGANIFSGDSGLITIWIEDEAFKPYEMKPNCSNCAGVVKNKCATVTGWCMTGSTAGLNTKIAYGITATVECECNYDLILCALPNDEFKAQILKYATSVELASLGLQTDRFNYFRIYAREELNEYIAISRNAYRKRIREYVDSLRPFLMKNDFCKCLKCEGSKMLPLV